MNIGVKIIIHLLNYAQLLKALYIISKKYSDKISFWGGIGTQSTFYSNKENIYRKVKEAIEVLGIKNKYVISPTHMLPGNVSLDNIEYFFEAVKYYGKN